MKAFFSSSIVESSYFEKSVCLNADRFSCWSRFRACSSDSKGSGSFSSMSRLGVVVVLLLFVVCCFFFLQSGILSLFCWFGRPQRLIRHHLAPTTVYPRWRILVLLLYCRPSRKFDSKNRKRFFSLAFISCPPLSFHIVGRAGVYDTRG